jgi:hypothetical protein
MMKAVIIFCLVFSTLTFFSCKKVINVDIKNASSQEVIAGEVTNAPGPYTVSITSTVNFSADNNFPPVSGALVIISDNYGLKDSLSEISPGVYATHTYWHGQPGNTYTLNVSSSGRSYTAVSTMPQLVDLDSVGFRQSFRGGGKQVIEPVANFQDPAGVANYYQFAESINDTVLNKIFIYSDRLSDGKYISQALDDDSTDLKIGNQLTFSMYCIDENVYQYLNELRQLLDANPFNEATPANPGSNISGGALGYFSAHTIQTKQLTVHL